MEIVIHRKNEEHLTLDTYLDATGITVGFGRPQMTWVRNFKE